MYILVHVQTYLKTSTMVTAMPAVRITEATKVTITIVTVTPTDSLSGSTVGCDAVVRFAP